MTNKPQFVGGRETVKLSEIAKIKAGNVAPKKDAFTEDGIPFVRAGSLTNLIAGESLADLEKIDCGTAKKLRLTLFPAGTVVFAKSGMSCMTGNVYVLPKPCYVVSHLACVIPNGNYASYLKHYFRFNRPNRLIENPSFPSIKLSKIQGIELRLPSPEEVVKQVQAIERIESQIEQAKALSTYLDSLVKSRFVEMFGDPVSNPKKLRTRPGSALFKIGNGKTKPMSERRETGYPAYGGNGVSWYSQQSLTYSPTIIIGRVGRHCGNTRLVNKPCWVTDNAMYIKQFRDNELNLIYLDELMQIVDFNRYADKGDLWKITQRPFMGFNYPLPPLPLQQEFADFVAQVDKSRFIAQQQIEKLQMLYDSLAQEYFG